MVLVLLIATVQARARLLGDPAEARPVTVVGDDPATVGDLDRAGRRASAAALRWLSEDGQSRRRGLLLTAELGHLSPRGDIDPRDLPTEKAGGPEGRAVGVEVERKQEVSS